MALLRPFRGLRPPPALAAELASLPYDVVSREEAARESLHNPHSYFHVTRPEVDLPPEVSDHDPRVHAQAAMALRSFLRHGWLEREATESLYLYRQRLGSHEQTGVVALASVDAYERGDIKRHEHTRADKEEDRVRHLDAVGAHDEPVFLTYRARADIDEAVERAARTTPLYDFLARDGVAHTFWRLSPDLSREILTPFSEVSRLYIADGHHRSAAASRVRQLRRTRGGDAKALDGFLAVVFPHSHLQVMGYHRLVRDLGGAHPADFLKALEPRFSVTPVRAAAPTRPHNFGMYLQRQWYRLEARPGTFDEGPLSALDASILQDNLLAPVLGIQEPRTDARMAFVGGIRGTEALALAVDSGTYAVAFALYPVTVEDMMRVADAGEVMPPKSTWFEPKLRSGLVLHSFDSDL